MCSFVCCVGESLRVGDQLLLEIQKSEGNLVWFAMETKPNSGTVVEIITPSDEDSFPPTGTAF